MFKRFLLRTLFRLVGLPLEKIDEEKIRFWLWSVYPNKSFLQYVSKKNMRIFQRMGEGVSRDEYLMLVGQRLAFSGIITDCKEAYLKVEKDRLEKAEAAKQTGKMKILKNEENKPKS